MSNQELLSKHTERKYSRFRPIHVLFEDGISDLEKKAVIEGISKVIQIADVDNDIAVKVLDKFEEMDNSGKTAIDACKGRNVDEDAVNGYFFRFLLEYELIGADKKKSPDKYLFWVLHSPIYDYIDKKDQKIMEQINGEAMDKIGGFISINRFRDTDKFSKKDRYNLIKTYTIHEILHVFGLFPYNQANPDEHCKNKCIMQSREPLFEQLSKKTLGYDEICPSCIDDLRSYFRK